jgi:hypothetical protein
MILLPQILKKTGMNHNPAFECQQKFSTSLLSYCSYPSVERERAYRSAAGFPLEGKGGKSIFDN